MSVTQLPTLVPPSWPAVLPSPRTNTSADPDDAPLTVAILAEDPVSRLGIAQSLRDVPGVRVCQPGTPSDVAIVTGDQLDDTLCTAVRRLRAEGTHRVLICVATVEEAGLFAAVEAGACGVIRRADATPERLTRALRAAASGDGALPPDLLGKLLDHVQNLQNRLLTPRGLRLSGLTDRETAVLRLVADGYDTREIADTLSYSERTVKNVIHDITSRLQVRNRAHAVAYALRQGLI